MIPARLGSKRLKQKNLRSLLNVPLLTRAVRKCKAANCFDSIWVNADDESFARIAREEGVNYHPRPAELANDTATSEEFVEEFLHTHPCDLIIQVHSIAPLIQADRVRDFVDRFSHSSADIFVSVLEEPLECLHNGAPVNFSLGSKQNSQDLEPVKRITWGLTGWRRERYLAARSAGRTATWDGEIGTYTLNRFEGHVIKTEEDLQLAECMATIIGME